VTGLRAWVVVTGLIGAALFSSAAWAQAQPPLGNLPSNVPANAPANVPANALASPPASGPLPGYLLVVGKATDRVKIGGYAAALPPIYASHEGYYLAIGGVGRGVTWLEGPWRDRAIVFARFPNREQVNTFWWGETYRAAIRKRDNAGVFSVVALEGLRSMPFEGPDAAYLIVMTASDGTPDKQALSTQAARALSVSVGKSGGVMMTSDEPNRFTPMEGDSVFDRIAVAAWPSKAARAAYLESLDARAAQSLRQQAGLSVVATADGVPRNQAPPAATTLPVQAPSPALVTRP